MKEDVLKYSKKYGLPPAKLVTQWNGFDVYESQWPVVKLPDGEELVPAIGPPQYILDKGGKVRSTTYDEGFEILDQIIKEHGLDKEDAEEEDTEE